MVSNSNLLLSIKKQKSFNNHNQLINKSLKVDTFAEKLYEKFVVDKLSEWDAMDESVVGSGVDERRRREVRNRINSYHFFVSWHKNRLIKRTILIRILKPALFNMNPLFFSLASEKKLNKHCVFFWLNMVTWIVLKFGWQVWLVINSKDLFYKSTGTN